MENINLEIIKIHNYENCTEALGPYKRFALWVQGCNKDCKGCMTPESRDINSGIDIDINKLVEVIIKSEDIEGITISGGEPFLQARELLNLISKVKSIKDIGVIIYTGYTYNELLNNSDPNNETVKKLLNYCDLLIDGPYKDELNDGLSLRGSSNQNIISLTERYKSIIDNYYNKKGRKVEFIVKSNEKCIIGVPSVETLKWFRNNKI